MLTKNSTLSPKQTKEKLITSRKTIKNLSLPTKITNAQEKLKTILAV